MKHLMLVAMVVAALQGCATPSQIAADAEVKRLCAIDGGVKVYETVKMPPDRFDRDGKFPIRDKDSAPGSDYYLEQETTELLAGDPRITKYTYKVIRRKDKKIMSISIRYVRGGGDISGPGFPSSFFCPPISKDTPSAVSSVFIKE